MPFFLRSYLLFTLFVVLNFVSLSGQDFSTDTIRFGSAETRLAGVLSVPVTRAIHPAVILISGSGAQNRDGDVFGFKTFKVIGDYLASRGIAVLRYDDRGFGESTGKSVGESTSRELAADVKEAVRFLKSRRDIDPGRIGLLGHSEGGIIAPMVAAEDHSLAFAVLMAGFGVKGVELSNAQQRSILEAGGMSSDFITKAQEMNRGIFAMMEDTATTDDRLSAYIKDKSLELLAMLPENVKAMIPDKEQYVKNQITQTLAQIKSPWLRYYMAYDPYPALTHVKCPVLMLFGELDTQVSPEQNKPVMEKALAEGGNKNVTTEIFPEANHLFQQAVTGSPNEYATLKKEYVPGFLEKIATWINSTVAH